jgi:hypothetical protein
MVPTVRLVVVTTGGTERVTMVPPKFVPAPTATQLTAPAHETPSREPTPDGAAVSVQLPPPSVVSMMDVPPTAVQLEVEMQLMLCSVVLPAGAPRFDQVIPPLVVVMTSLPTA